MSHHTPRAWALASLGAVPRAGAGGLERPGRETELGPARGPESRTQRSRKELWKVWTWRTGAPLREGAAGGGVPRLQSPPGWRQRPCVGLRHPVITAGHSSPALEVPVKYPGPLSLKQIPQDPTRAGSLLPGLPILPPPGPPRTTGALGRAAPARPLPSDSGHPVAPTFRMQRACGPAEASSRVFPPTWPPTLRPRCLQFQGDAAARDPSCAATTRRGAPVRPAPSLHSCFLLL